MERLTAKETEIQTQFSDGTCIEKIDPGVVEMYNGVKVLLSRYRAGKLPKAFKVIPVLQNWEQVSAACIFIGFDLLCLRQNAAI